MNVRCFCLALLFGIMVTQAVGQTEISSSVPREEDAREGILNELLEVTIPEVKFDDVPLSTALDQVMRLAKEASAGQLKIKGIIMADPAPRVDRLTLRLEKIPLGELCRIIANFYQVSYTEKSGFILFLPFGRPDPNNGITYVELDDNLRKELRLKEFYSDQDIRAALARFRIRLPEEAEVRVARDGRSFGIKGPIREMQLIDSVVELIRRGLTLEQAR